MVMRDLRVSERRACKTIGQVRSTQRYEPLPNQEQERLQSRVIELATEFGRYGDLKNRSRSYGPVRSVPPRTIGLLSGSMGPCQPKPGSQLEFIRSPAAKDLVND